MRCGTNARHWFAGEATCQRCQAPNPGYHEPVPFTGKTRADQMLEFTRILAGYGCAGVDQEPDDLNPCGKCSPCEANAFLRKIGRL